MARAFSSASSQYGELTGTFPNVPLTMACWFNRSAAQAQVIMAVGTGANGSRAGTWLDAGNYSNFVVSNSTGSVTSNVAITTATTAGVWYHLVGVTSSTTSRLAYLNGTASSTATTSVTMDTPDYIDLGTRTVGGTKAAYFSGRLADCAVWDAALTQDEVTSLYKGMSPLHIRPANLKFYAPLWGNASPEINLCGGTVTLGNSPTKYDHPRIYS